MDRRAILWTLVVFFGASIVFRAVNEVTEGEEAWLRVSAQLVALAVLVAAVALYVRRARGD